MCHNYNNVFVVNMPKCIFPICMLSERVSGILAVKASQCRLSLDEEEQKQIPITESFTDPELQKSVNF